MHTIGNPVLDGVGQPIMIEVDEDGNEVPGAGKTEEEKKVRVVLAFIAFRLCSCLSATLVRGCEQCTVGPCALRAVYSCTIFTCAHALRGVRQLWHSRGSVHNAISYGFVQTQTLCSQRCSVVTAGVRVCVLLFCSWRAQTTTFVVHVEKSYMLKQLCRSHRCLNAVSCVVSFSLSQEDEDDELKALITSFKNMTGLWDLDPDDSAWCVSCAVVLFSLRLCVFAILLNAVRRLAL
jgi:hypothetical protein